MDQVANLLVNLTQLFANVLAALGCLLDQPAALHLQLTDLQLDLRVDPSANAELQLTSLSLLNQPHVLQPLALLNDLADLRLLLQ